MAHLKGEEVDTIVRNCMKGIGRGKSVNFSELKDTLKSSLVNCINSEFRKRGFDIGLSEPKLDDFHSIEDLAKWCYENQTEYED